MATSTSGRYPSGRHIQFKDRLIGRKIELLQDEFPGLWILLQPLPYNHYKAVCSYFVKDPASGFVLIWTDERAGSAPNVFVQFRTADSAIGCIGLTVIPDRIGDYAKEFFPGHVVPEDAHFGILWTLPTGCTPTRHIFQKW